MAEDLHRREDLFKVEIIAIQVADGEPGRGTNLGRKILQTYITLRYLVDKEFMSDNTFRTEFRAAWRWRQMGDARWCRQTTHFERVHVHLRLGSE
jgi:hypothetical protein